MHSLQKTLLRRLLTKNGLKYSDLTSGFDFEDNIVFHLKQLQSNNLIVKNSDLYSLTAEGLKAAKNEEAGLKMFFLGFLCEYRGKFLIREHSEGETKFYNLPSGKPRFSERIESALARSFMAATGLETNNFEFLSLHLKTVQTSKGEVLFDDAFAIYKASVAAAGPLNSGMVWFTPEEIKQLPNRWPEIDICILKKDLRPYLSYQFTSDHILTSSNLTTREEPKRILAAARR
jgi:ADP-ribose pyrophosphatase YjhB (NUDIX family)